MNIRSIAALLCLVSTAAIALEPLAIPAESIAKKKELLFADDFEGAEPAKVWHKVVPSFAVEKGLLKGTQTRDKDVPAAGGKVARTAGPNGAFAISKLPRKG